VSNVVASVKADLLQYCREAARTLSGRVTSAPPAQHVMQLAALMTSVERSAAFKQRVAQMTPALCKQDENGVTQASCLSYVQEILFCFTIAEKLPKLHDVEGIATESKRCQAIDQHMPGTSLIQSEPAPEDQLAKEMSHDLEMNFNKIAPFGKEDTAKELQDHAAKTQDTLVDAVENAEVAEIKRAVFRALTRLRAATIKEFDTIARLETQAIDAYNDAHHYRAENPLSHLHEDEAPLETDKLKSFH